MRVVILIFQEPMREQSLSSLSSTKCHLHERTFPNDWLSQSKCCRKFSASFHIYSPSDMGLGAASDRLRIPVTEWLVHPLPHHRSEIQTPGWGWLTQPPFTEMISEEEECPKEPSSPEEGLELQTDPSGNNHSYVQTLLKKIKVYIL
ncbi:hypothetical protein TNCV_3466941 [Trichonephila clavipes]|nr:hypothetical protein TNCV_3466941 [Trichonephila clavipes]